MNESRKRRNSKLPKYDTWKQVPISDAKTQILPGTWAFCHAGLTPDGNIRKHKAWHCVRGDLQENVDERDF
jgi:hypothetical protein